MKSSVGLIDEVGKHHLFMSTVTGTAADTDTVSLQQFNNHQKD